MAASTDRGPVREHSDIAIVGMAVRLPRAETLPELWRNVVDGVDCITTEATPRNHGSGPVFARGVLSDIDMFDAPFFEIPGREAELLDPQHRVFLELCWNALEDAGLADRRLDGRRASVYAACGANTFLAAAQPHLRSQTPPVELHPDRPLARPGPSR